MAMQCIHERTFFLAMISSISFLMVLRAAAVQPELPFTVAELPLPRAEAWQLHAGRRQDHLRDVQQEGKLVSTACWL
jgi:hypothetical protein